MGTGTASIIIIKIAINKIETTNKIDIVPLESIGNTSVFLLNDVRNHRVLKIFLYTVM